ncbi:hypothetical protein BX600DRAFT_508197 [Xylariales sp. PMI_506]|nr:hypothetical protein BX600DRAFT_508197 [Xylariales sp. PMI_506]
MAFDHQHISPCPALRAAAEQGQHLSNYASTRPESHYDPVHSSASSGGWWQAYQHGNPHHGWQPPYPPQFARNPPHMYTPNFPGALGLPPPSGVPQPNSPQYPTFGMHDPTYTVHGHPHPHAHSPPPFNHRPTLTSLTRIGNTAPAQHMQIGFGGQGLHPVPAPSQAPQVTSPRSNDHPSSNSTPIETESRNPPGRASEGSSPQRVPRTSPGRILPIPHSSINSAPDLPRAFGGNARIRRNRLPVPNSEPSSDEDSDPNDPDVALGFLESISAGGLHAALSAPETGLRAVQVLRGAAPGKRIASRGAIASLESVKISDLPEKERTCIICYNDFGTDTPEGINEAPLRLPKCKHVFGDHCIKKWFEESDSCPYCRDKLPSESPYRNHHPQAVLHFIRQQQQMQAYRQSREPGSHGRPGDGSPMSALAEFYENAPSIAYRRHDGRPAVRTSAWYSDGRMPSSDLNEGRRRTRPRHGSLRSSPPSVRPSPYVPSTVGQPYTPFSPGASRPYHSHRHSVTFASPTTPPRLADGSYPEPHSPSPYGQVPGMPVHAPGNSQAEQFPNPLGNGPFFGDVNHMQHHSWHRTRNAVSAVSGVDVHMSQSEGTAPRSAPTQASS